jgi:hypothetical protein
VRELDTAYLIVRSNAKKLQIAMKNLPTRLAGVCLTTYPSPPAAAVATTKISTPVMKTTEGRLTDELFEIALAHVFVGVPAS